MAATINDIFNFRQLTPTLATAGQPDAEELLAICHAGYEVVINLGLQDAPYALQDEAKIVTGQGLEYHHLPVDFQAPEMARFHDFRELLNGLSERRCFIHCAANKRVSCFMALYRIIELGWSRQEAEREMLLIWRPDAAWQAFMDEALEQIPRSSN